jgi:hypothetical protein
MSDFLSFLALIGTELYDLWTHSKSGAPDEAVAQRLAMRIARRVSDEMMLRDLSK